MQSSKWFTARWIRVATLLLILLVSVYALYLDFRVRDEFEGRRFAIPARVYARPLEFHVGLRLPPAALEQELRQIGYRDSAGGDEGGWYNRAGERFEIGTRAFTFWDGLQPPQRLRLEFSDSKLTSLRDNSGKDVTLARLEPLLIGGIYPAHNEDRVLVKLGDVPPHLVQALISMEDRQFYSHIGIDPRGLARAVKNTVTGDVQGGSTLTQQLVKNFFLSSERTLQRKFTEVIMAVLLELHYDKNEILETYLNEIYLGQDRNRAIHGVGLAAQFYFGKPVQQLTLPESALLVGMIKGPSIYDPHRHAQRALQRRNLVLQEMKNLERLTIEQYSTARATPLTVNPKPSMGTSPHPAFVDLVRRQLRQDYDESDLQSEGLRIFTTLDPRVQGATERALSQRLAQLDKKSDTPLEGAAIVTNSQNGEVQAVVGGRDVRFQGFNRALDAARPVGSLLKPVVYLTALSQSSKYTLVTPIDDSKLVWKSRGAKDWEPANYDKKYHGQVPLRTALANSYNVATVRLGTQIGIESVLSNARRLGIERELPPYASSLLGSIDATPLEMTRMYQTIASGGFRTPLRAIREVLTKEDKPLQRYALSVEQVFEAEPVYLLTSALQDAVYEGTGQGLKTWLRPELGVAGKTGTTDELRDSWFAGFTGDRLAVVWIGYDDNRPTRLTGASGAMTVWGEMMAAIDPEPLVLPQPEKIERVWVDVKSGLLADKDCSGAIELPFVNGTAPTEKSPCAGSNDGAKGFFRRLFGK